MNGKMNKRVLKIVLALALVTGAFFIVFNWLMQNIPNQQDLCGLSEKMYRNDEYSGIVITKYVDRENHMRKTVEVREEFSKKTITLDADTGRFFEFVQPNDSIVKNHGELFVTVKRNGVTSKIDFRFRCPGKE